MARKNGKRKVTSYESSIKKSNELSMAKLNKGLSLNQMQLLAYAIYSTQQKEKTEFSKSEFEKMFGITKYNTTEARKDVPKLSILQFSTIDIENDVVDYLNVFQRIRYEKGLFTFKWAEDIVPHILDLEKYSLTDLGVKSKFKSSFSWTLYDYLKGLFGHWHKPISKEALMKLFCVEKKKTYQNTAQFKRAVLDVAIAEINEYTELEVRYNEEKEGRSIVAFDLIWSKGTEIEGATRKQIKELQVIINTISEDMFEYINLRNDDLRNKAIQLVRQTESMKVEAKEPICITKEYASELITKANYSLNQLEKLSEADKTGRTDLYYDWLNE